MSATADALLREARSVESVTDRVSSRLISANVREPEPPEKMMRRFSLNGTVAELKEALSLVVQAIEWVSWQLGVAEGRKSNLEQRVKDSVESAFIKLDKSEGNEKYRMFVAQRTAAPLEREYEDACSEVFLLNRRLAGLKSQKEAIECIWWMKKSGLD